MNKLLLITYVIISVVVTVNAGVSDHILYDQRNRYQFEALDGVVAVAINGYYGFSDIGLIKTVTEERKNISSREYPSKFKSGRISTHYGTENFYDSRPGANETLQLIRQTLWLLDVTVTETFYGSFDTNRFFVAVKGTRAYTHEELPQHFLSASFSNEVVLGLIRIDDEEFKNSYRGLSCYLRNDLSFLDRNYVTDLDEKLNFSNDYSFVFKDLRPTPCYVAREIGVRPRNVNTNENPGEQSAFMVALKNYLDNQKSKDDTRLKLSNEAE